MSLTGKTLIAGFLAFLASFLLFCSAVYSDFARKKRKALVSRSFLPHSLVKIDCYLRDSFDEKNNQGNLCDNYERIRHHSDMIGLAFINGVVSRMYPYSRELVDYDFSFLIFRELKNSFCLFGDYLMDSRFPGIVQMTKDKITNKGPMTGFYSEPVF